MQGCTIKPLVRYLNIKLARKDEKMRLFVEFNSGMISHLSQGDHCDQFMQRATDAKNMLVTSR